MWKESINETEYQLYYYRVSNFKQYLKAITSLYTGSNGWHGDLWNCDYEQWHTYFQTRHVDYQDEFYNENETLPNPENFKCDEDDLGLVPDHYPAILVWNAQEEELSIF